MSDEKRFKCSDCGKEFPTKEIMMQHKKDAHKVAEQKPKKPWTFKRVLPYLILVLIIVAAVFLIRWILINSANNPGSITSFNFSYVPFEGNASAQINVIEFADYQCPICSDWVLQSQSKLTSDYIDTGKVKFYFVDMAFLGPDSTTLAEGAWCANEQNLFYAYHDYVFSHQGSENSGWATPDKLKTMVTNINGLDAQQFNTCLDSNKYQSRVTQLTEIGYNSQVTGTPTFFIGNNSIGYVTLVGNQPYSLFKQKIDSQLSQV
jgi:protein-disulfide isomerase